MKAIQQEENGIISAKIDVDEGYGISRSFRRGSVTEATNAPANLCTPDDIKRNALWRSEDAAGTKQPSLDMLRLYTDTMGSIKANLKFSYCL